jgi:chemotaxis signal transduction protein
MKTENPELARPEQAQPVSILFQVGNTVRTIPIAAVCSIAPIKSAAYIPFGNEAFEGLVFNDEGICPQFDYSSSHSGIARSGTYSICLRTSKGIVSLRIDSVLSLHAQNHPAYTNSLDAIAEVEDLISEFTALDKAITHKKSEVTSKESVIPLLLIQLQSQTFAIEARDVNLVERHIKSTPISNEDCTYRVIELETGKLENGISLSSWMNLSNASPESEKWSIGINYNNANLLVTTDHVLGIEQFMELDVHCLSHDDKSTFWLKHPMHGSIRVLKTGEFNKEEKFSWAKELSTPPTPSSQTLRNNGIAGVGLTFEKFDAVVPTAALINVREQLTTSNLSNKAYKGALPVFDMTKAGFSPLTCPEKPQRLIILNSIKNRAIAALVPHVYQPNAINPWVAPEMLPHKLFNIVKEARISNHRCELLLKETFVSELSKPSLNSLTKNSFCGWASRI